MSWNATTSIARRQPIRSYWFMDLAYLVFVLTVFLFFLLPPDLLRKMGWDYLGGGAEFEKIHIATYLAILEASLLFAMDARFRNIVIALLCRELTFTAFVVAAAAVAMFAVVVKKTSIAPFVDTFVAAFVVTIGCLCLPGRQLRLLSRLLDAFFIVNIGLAFYEYHTKVSIIYLGGYQDTFRSSAFFENPLSAATLLGLYSLVQLIMTRVSFSLESILRLSLSVAALAAVLTTGGRTALVATLAIEGLFVGFSFLLQLRNGYFNKAGLIYSVFAFPTAIVGLAILWWLGLFDIMLARFQDDVGSASTRELALNMVANLSGRDLWFGLSVSNVLNLTAIQQEFGLIAIEISWVNFILVCGLLFTIPLFVTYCFFLFHFIPKYTSLYALFPALFLLIATAASNGIWAKTTILTSSVALLITHMRRVVPVATKI